MAFLTITVSLVLPLLLLAATLLYRRGRQSAATQPPKPRAAKSGSFAELLQNRHRILDWTTESLSASRTATVTTFLGIVTANPSNVEHILKDRFDNYPKGSHSTTILFDFLGSGIFNSDGDHWRLQRKTASLEFSTKTIRTFVMSRVRLESNARLLPRLAAAAGSGEILDLQDLLERLAFDNVCQVSFGHDPSRLDSSNGDPDSADFARAFESASELCVRRYSHPFPFTWKLLRLLNLGSERRLRREIDTVHGFAMRVVRARKRAGRAALGDDLLSRFIAEADYPDEFLRDIIISFVLAGRDTTSATLTWFFWLISTRPAVKNRILDEIKSVRAKTGKTMEKEPIFTLDEVREMEYLHAALSETLRLYPPVPLQTRACAEDDVLPDGTKARKGQIVMYSSFAMGRSERIWGLDWAEYRPERWLEKGVFRAVNPFRFPVFHAGPRMCLGKEMAYIQMKTVAAAVMERFDIQVLDKDKEREPDFTMILRVKGGLPVRVRDKTVGSGVEP